MAVNTGSKTTNFSNVTIGTASGGGALIVGGLQIDPRSETLTANNTLTVAESGKTFFIATDSLVITLPAVVAGVTYTFINSGADGNNIITISPNASDAIHGVITLAGTIVELGGTDDKDLINTKTTAGTSDSVTLLSNGTDWFVVSSTGIWASEA